MKFVILIIALFAVSVSAKAIKQDKIFGELLDVLLSAVNTQVQNAALLGAQLLAGLSQTGISGVTDLVGKRAIDEKGLSDFFSNLGNQLYESLYPVVDSTFSSLSLSLAQILAGVAMNGIGKREVEINQKFLDTITAALLDVYNQVLFPAINTQVQNVALLGAQLLAGLSQTGINGLTDIMGKREVKDFFTDLGNSLYESLFPVVDTAFQSLSLTLAQLLAGVAMNGIGKREVEINQKFLDTITAALLDVYNQVLFPAINTQVQNVALLGAQLLAGLSQTGINGLTDIMGKREVKDFFTDLGNSLYESLFPVVDTAFQSLSLTLAQLLAGVAMNGIGKREVNQKFLDTITAALLDVYNQVLFPAINTQVQNVALLGAQLLAGLSQTGINGLTDIVGK